MLPFLLSVLYQECIPKKREAREHTNQGATMLDYQRELVALYTEQLRKLFRLS
jgi:hypothetical protein